jgi:hypothetical protein
MDEAIKYYDLNEILQLDIPDSVKDKLKEAINKLVFYDNNGSCRVGKLIGIANNDTSYYYIIEINNYEYFVSIWESMTKL